MPGVQKIAAAEPAGDQPRQVAGVVHVRVGQDHGVDGGRVDGQRVPVAPPQLLEPLEQPAVDEHAPVAGLDQVLGAGDGAGGTEEGQLRHA